MALIREVTFFRFGSGLLRGLELGHAWPGLGFGFDADTFFFGFLGEALAFSTRFADHLR